MLVELIKPIALMLCILALYGVFSIAFLAPASDLQYRIWGSLELLALAGGISLVSGLIFREPATTPSRDSTPLTATLPMQVFFWAASIMVILFIVSWYLENYGVFYRDIRRL